MKPLLAAKFDPKTDKLRYPVMVSPKIDGIRCLLIDGKPLSRTLKPIPNLHVQKTLASCVAGAGFGNLNLDGELIVVDPETGKDADFSAISSAIMSKEGRPHFVYRVFDLLSMGQNLPFAARYNKIAQLWDGTNSVEIVTHVGIGDDYEFGYYADWFVEQGYEGMMIRDPHGLYKHGRSTLNEQILLKYKLFDDAEFEIVGMVELKRNENEAYTNEVGATKRSTAAAGRVAAGTMGALVLRGTQGRPDFEVGTGFTTQQRDEMWALYREDLHNPAIVPVLSPGKILGKYAKIKYQGYGSQNRPRFPSFQGLRHEDDK